MRNIQERNWPSMTISSYVWKWLSNILFTIFQHSLGRPWCFAWCSIINPFLMHVIHTGIFNKNTHECMIIAFSISNINCHFNELITFHSNLLYYEWKIFITNLDKPNDFSFMIRRFIYPVNHELNLKKSLFI